MFLKLELIVNDYLCLVDRAERASLRGCSLIALRRRRCTTKVNDDEVRNKLHSATNKT